MVHYLKGHPLEHETLEGTELIIADDERRYYLGPDLTLKRCSVIVRAHSRNWHIIGAQFIDCSIAVKKRQTNFQDWCAGNFGGCAFTGNYYGNDFGNWPEYFGSKPVRGSIADCDFSGAVLDACRFMRTDMKTVKLPRWPCFTVLGPGSRARELGAFAWPDALRVWAESAGDNLEICSALVYHAPSLAKRKGCTEAEIREALERFGGVIM